MGSIITSLGAGIVYPNQVTLPAVNTDRAGEVFIHQGQAWRFTDGTEGWDLPVGTPWPVKGYKEYSVTLDALGGVNPAQDVLENTLGITASWVRESAGTYTLTDLRISGRTDKGINSKRVIWQDSAINDDDDIYIEICNPSVNNVVIMHLDGTGSQVDNLRYVFTIRQYPPLP
jgi:hypothetical protein